jgi:hypothetical protein
MVWAKILEHFSPLFTQLSAVTGIVDGHTGRLQLVEAAMQEVQTAQASASDERAGPQSQIDLLTARADQAETECDQLRSASEFADRRARAANMIVHNVPEDGTQAAQQLLLHGSPAADVGLLSFERMGPPKPSPLAKPRPICARFTSRSARQAAFKRSSAFTAQGMSLREDLTPAQRALKASRASEVATLRSQGFQIRWRGTTLFKTRDGSAPVLVPPAAHGGRSPPAAFGGRPTPAAHGEQRSPAAPGEVSLSLPAAAAALPPPAGARPGRPLRSSAPAPASMVPPPTSDATHIPASATRVPAPFNPDAPHLTLALASQPSA